MVPHQDQPRGSGIFLLTWVGLEWGNSGGPKPGLGARVGGAHTGLGGAPEGKEKSERNWHTIVHRAEHRMMLGCKT